MSRVLVNVPGAGRIPKDYYREALQALTQILGAEPAHLPCWFSDLFESGGTRSARPLPPEARQARAALVKEMLRSQKELEREQRTRAKSRPASAAARPRVKRRRAARTTRATRGPGGLSMRELYSATDVVRYLFDPRLQTSIRGRLAEVLEQAARNYTEIVLVSHSLGTVVAFDVLRDLAPRYPLQRFVTMGAPLRKLALIGCQPMDLGAITPETVPFWRNLYDTTDLIADAIGPAFPGYPIEDVFIQVADLPVPSHDYWPNEQVLNMIAGWLR